MKCLKTTKLLVKPLNQNVPGCDRGIRYLNFPTSINKGDVSLTADNQSLSESLITPKMSVHIGDFLFFVIINHKRINCEMVSSYSV